MALRSKREQWKHIFICHHGTFGYLIHYMLPKVPTEPLCRRTQARLVTHFNLVLVLFTTKNISRSRQTFYYFLLFFFFKFGLNPIVFHFENCNNKSK